MAQPTVLIADDEPTIRDLYSKAFIDAGISVLTAVNGEECIATALQYHPDLILIDINMPGMDGHTAVDTIRRDQWGASAKIIYLTNHSSPEHVASAVAHKSEKFIVKANSSVKEVVNEARLAMHTK